MFNEKIYKYSIRDTTEPLFDEDETAVPSGNGGSGESHFSNANVTVRSADLENGSAIYLTCPAIADYEQANAHYSYSVESFIGDPTETTYQTDFRAILYDGLCYLTVIPSDFSTVPTITCTGSIQPAEDTPLYKVFAITGDGTILIGDNDPTGGK